MASIRWLLLFATLTVLCDCAPDNIYQYWLDEDGIDTYKPTLRLLDKRQAPTKEVNQKKLDFHKSGTDSPDIKSTTQAPVPSDSNTMSSNPSTSSTAASATTTPTPTTTVSLEDTKQVDYDNTNVTVQNITQDYHRYYNSSTYLDGMQFWVDFDRENASTHDMLSSSHRRAATIQLTFDFPFYGHMVRNITIATGGFLYTGDYVHSWLAATQYIAPLMANFDTGMSNSSTIKYMDNGTAFAVQWENVALQDKPEAGNFTFQATLLKSGDIIFAYKEIPVNITSIADEAHPVKVGVSDAYIIDRTIFFVRRKTIYEYHKVDKKTDDVSTGSAIYFTALPTCVSLNSCDTCVNNTIDFDCVWCSNAERCSDGMDRHRQDWIVKGCDKVFVGKNDNCSASFLTSTTSSPTLAPVPMTDATYFPTTYFPSKFTSTSTIKPFDFDPTASRVENADASDEAKTSSVSSVVGILFLVAILVGCGGWVFYAYRNPHTPSGQCFIRYRPSQWRWRSGEAHYTAAAIHM